MLVAEYVKPDSKRRVALGVVVPADGRYLVYRNARGQILLDPVALPPKEAWLWDNSAALASVKQGLCESAAGQTVSLGSFSQRRRKSGESSSAHPKTLRTNQRG